MQPVWGELFSVFPVLVGRIPLATFFTIVPLVKPRHYRCVSRLCMMNTGASQGTTTA